MFIYLKVHLIGFALIDKCSYSINNTYIRTFFVLHNNLHISNTDQMQSVYCQNVYLQLKLDQYVFNKATCMSGEGIYPFQGKVPRLFLAPRIKIENHFIKYTVYHQYTYSFCQLPAGVFFLFCFGVAAEVKQQIHGGFTSTNICIASVVQLCVKIYPIILVVRFFCLYFRISITNAPIQL